MGKYFHDSSFLLYFPFFILTILCVPIACLSRESDLAEEKEYKIYTSIGFPLKDVVGQRLLEAFKRTGRRARVIRVGSSERALIMANEQGDGDAIRVPWIKDIAPILTNNLLQVPEPVALIELHAFAKDSSFPINGWDSLRGLKCGSRIGLKIAEKHLPNDSVFLPETDRLFQMLESGRLDVVVEHALIGDAILSQPAYSSLHKLYPSLVAVPAYTYLHKSNRHLIARIAEALRSMKKDGSYTEIEDNILQNARAQ